jgi:geranylgeranyl pyrophosphate synthase
MSITSNMPEELREEYAQALPIIERALEEALPDKCDSEWLTKVTRGVGQHWDVEVVTETIFRPFAYYVRQGGKRYRPFVTYLVLNAFDEDPRRYLPALASSEYVHVASLICDDVADNSKLRRGQPTAHLAYGVPVSINVAFTAVHYVGILMEESELDLPDRTRNALYGLMNRAIFASCVGLAGDVVWSLDGPESVTDAQVWQHMMNRTCPLTFVVPVMIGALLADAPQKALIGLEQWATLVGAIYQLVDDMLNLRPLVPKWGKEWAEDLDEKKRTLLISYARNHLAEADRERLSGLIDQKVLTDDDKTEIISMIGESGAFEYVSNQIQLLRDDAIQCLTDAGLDSEKAKPLSLFTEFVANRTF